MQSDIEFLIDKTCLKPVKIILLFYTLFYFSFISVAQPENCTAVKCIEAQIIVLNNTNESIALYPVDGSAHQFGFKTSVLQNSDVSAMYAAWEDVVGCLSW